MESHTSSKSNLSECDSWDFDTMCQNTAKLDEMMLSMKQTENIQGNMGNKRKDTLARREEIAWQREEVIHTREKELREWELMLEEKSRLLIEKEKQLKYDKEKVLQIAAVHNSKENSRKSSLSDAALSSFTLEQHSKVNTKNEFVLEKEHLLQEKEKVICEKLNNIERMEQSVSAKEQQLNNQRLSIEKERELVAQKNHSLYLREQVVTKTEEAVQRKLKVIYEEKKSLGERKTLLTQKENALSAAAEHIQNKEQTLNERENMIIEKERSIIGQIRELGKCTEPESFSEENKELIKKFDEIFGEKWKSLQERENTVLISEQILQEKWREYTEAKELLNSEQLSLNAIRDTFEKEKNILREWEKLVGKRDEIDERSELIKSSSDTNYCVLSDESVRTWPLDVQTKTDSRIKRSSPFGAVGQLLNDDINLNISDANKSGDLFGEIPNSENREISGDELFQFYEKEKESLHKLLLKDNIDTSTQYGKSSNSEGNGKLTEPVEASFKRNGASSSESKGEQGIGSEIYCKTGQVTSSTHKESRQNVSPPDNILKDADELLQMNDANKLKYPQNISTFFENVYVQDTTSGPPKTNTNLLQMINKGCNVIPSPDLEMDETLKTVEKNNKKQSEAQELAGKDDGTIPNGSKFAKLQETGDVLQNTSSNVSTDKERINCEKESSLKNGNVICNINSEVSCTPVSPLSSASSSRSLTSPISGRGSPSSRTNKKKLPKDALLQAISKRNFLETVQLLDTNSISLEVRNNEGRSALLLAVECGNIELVERLINKGADIKACDYKGSSALHIAVTENNLEMVHFLLQGGLNPLVTNNNGKSALQLASILQHVTMTEVLNNHIAAKSS